MSKKREPNHSSGGLLGERAAVLEVLGFDLLAQVEAMLRNTRQYQREVQRFRQTIHKERTRMVDLSLTRAVQGHVKRLEDAGASFRETLRGIKQAAGRRWRAPHGG